MSKLPTNLYSSTPVDTRKFSAYQYATVLAEHVYDNLVCGRRLTPEEVYSLLKFQEEKRNL